MRNLRAIFAAVLAGAMSVTVPSVPALADGSGSITIKAGEDQTLDGKTFTAYEIFTLNYVNEGDEDNNPNNDFAYDLKEEYEAFIISEDWLNLTPGINQTIDACAYQYFASCDDLNQLAKKLYDYSISKNVSGVSGSLNDTKDRYRIGGLEDGYYMVFETVTEEGGTLSKAMLGSVVTEVDASGNTGVKNVVINQKADVPTLTKEIYHNELGTWGMVGDNQIGDYVAYRIISKIPDTSGFASYQYVVHDYMEDGLTFLPETMKVYTDEAKEHEVKAGWSVKQDQEDGCDFEVEVNRETLDQLFAAGEKTLFFYYECVLNEKAEVASEHNDNSSYLQYSNNPYMDTTTTSKKTTVYDYTFVFDGSKINEKKEALEGAVFELRREGKVVELLRDQNNHYYVRGNIEEAAGMQVTHEVTTAADGKIYIVGLDDSVAYTLSEIQAPAGYIPAEDTVFSVDADYKVDGEINQMTSDNEDVFIQTYKACTTIINEGQPDIPRTGGPGTAYLFITSGLLAGCGIACLVIASKTRKEN